MNTVPFQELNTQRLHLRMLVVSDWEEISYLRSDTIVNQYIKAPAAETKEKALAFIEKIRLGIASGEFYYWAISLKDSSRMIGSISLWHFSEDKLKAEVGYALHPDDQGKGMMSEALIRVMSFGFEILALEHIEAYTQHNNNRSLQLLKRNGFEFNPEIKDASNFENVVWVKNKK